MTTTPFTLANIASLIAIATGKPASRAANMQAATARLTKVCEARGLNADLLLAQDNAEAATACLQAQLASLTVPAEATPVAPEAPVAEAPEAETSEDATVERLAEAFFEATGQDRESGAFIRGLLRDAWVAGAASGKPGRKPRAKVEREARPAGSKTKREIAADLLTRAEGCTAREILDATGWPAVSVPQIAKASGLTLRQEKDGRTTRYYGTAAEA